MLTREEAKTKICPYKHVSESARDKGRESYFTVNCTAEQCPKWVDIVVDELDYKGARTTLWGSCADCPEKENPKYMTPEYASKCLACKYHIGRCGG